MTKAKYEVTVDSFVRYFCVTTTRNTEDMINILSGMFPNDNKHKVKIFQYCNGEKKLVYGTHYSRKEPRKVIDTVTGETYNSAQELATHLKKEYVLIRLWLGGSRKTMNRYKYLDQVKYSLIQ